MTWQSTPYAVGSAGQQISPEGGGRILQFAESALTHPTHTDGFVDKGDPVIAGNVTGVALLSASAATDQVSVETGGIWCLNVVASDARGTIAVAVGDIIYVAPATGILSRDCSGMYFGQALSTLTGSADAAACVVALGPPRLKDANTVVVSCGPLAAADVAKTVFVAHRAMKLILVKERHGTKAGQAGTLQLEKCTAGEAAAAGDVLLAAAFDLTSDNDTTVEKLAVTTAAATLAAGDAIRMKLASGAATSLADASLTLVFELV